MKSNFVLRAVLVVAGLLVVGVSVYFWGNRMSGEQAGEKAVSVKGKIAGVTVRRMGEQMQVKLRLRLSQSGPSPLRLEAPLVVLRSESGVEVPRYLGPMLPEPVLQATGGTEEEVLLYYWLKGGESGDQYTLMVDGTAMKLPLMPGVTNVPDGEDIEVKGKN